jgi:hypothetical protein
VDDLLVPGHPAEGNGQDPGREEAADQTGESLALDRKSVV